MVKLDVCFSSCCQRSIIWLFLYIILIWECRSVSEGDSVDTIYGCLPAILLIKVFPSNLVNIGQTPDMTPTLAHLTKIHITWQAGPTGPRRLATDGHWCWGQPAWRLTWAPCWCLPPVRSPVSPPVLPSIVQLTDWLAKGELRAVQCRTTPHWENTDVTLSVIVTSF